MEFPVTDRVIYDSNPLSEVVFQVRFPRILEIDERLPAEFQKALGPGYPFVETREGVAVPPALAALSPDFVSLKRTHYDFLTEGRETTITLFSEFLAITTRRYDRWETFSSHIESAMAALSGCYTVPMFTRVGLRYVDQISRNKLGIPDTRWSELVKLTALGIVAEDDIPIDDVLELQSATILRLPDDAKATIRTGFGKFEETGDENIFFVDSDFFFDKVIKGKQDAIDLCSSFNRSAGYAFRWFITEQLHQALKPRSP